MRLSLSVVRKYAPIRWCALNREHNFDPAHQFKSNSHTRFLGVLSDRKKSLFQRSEMEDNAVLLHESVIRGHHIYKSVWSPRVGEIVSVDREHRNTHELFVCWKEARLLTMLPEKRYWAIVQHLAPRSFTITWCGRGLVLNPRTY